MLCPVCLVEIEDIAVTGALLRQSCSKCRVHVVEVVDSAVDPADLLKVLMQVIQHTRKEVSDGTDSK